MTDNFDHLLATCPREMRLGKCPDGFVLEMIEISCGDVFLGVTYKDDILAFTYHGLAIHKAPWAWHITHMRSGKIIMRQKTKRDAVKAAKTLAGLGNWCRAESTLKRHREWCEAAIEVAK